MEWSSGAYEEYSSYVSIWIQIHAFIVGGPRSISHLTMFYVIYRDQISLTGRSEEHIHIYIYIYIYIYICLYYFYVNLHEYDVYILWCFICCMHPFGLCQVEPGIQGSLDARLGSVQIRVI